MRSKLNRTRRGGFTLTELSVAAAVFGLFSVALLTGWNALQVTSINVSTLAERQNDQMRAFDYLRRDIRRAKTVAVVMHGSGAAVGDGAFGDELKLTLPDYYSDGNEEDDPHFLGPVPDVMNNASVAAGVVSYGSDLTVRYYIATTADTGNVAGSLVRKEGAFAGREVASSVGQFSLAFSKDTGTGNVRCRVVYNQPMLRLNASNSTTRRQVDLLCAPRVLIR